MSLSAGADAAMNPPYPLHPSVVDKLSPQYVSWYNKHLLNAQQAHHQPLEVSRFEGKVSPAGSIPLDVGRTQDLTIPRQESFGPDIRIRCFTPDAESPSDGWPGTLYYHGGGWVFGDITTENAVCTNLCVRARSVVITTDYRLAPENPYPAAVEDAWETLLWLVKTGCQCLSVNLSKIAVGGSSAGANLAAVIPQRLVTRLDLLEKINLRVQLLVVPVLDNTATVQTNTTYRLYEHTAGLSAAKILWYRHHYLPNTSSWPEPDASPLFFQGDLARLPPTVILVGEVDVLRQEGEMYARKLSIAGVPIRIEVMSGMPHAFLAMDAVLDEGRRAVDILCSSLEEAFR